MDDFGSCILVLVSSCDCYPEHIGLATMSLQDRTGIEHRRTGSEITIDPLHIAIIIDERAFGIEIVGIGRSILY